MWLICWGGGNGTKTYFGCMYRVFGTHSLWWGTLLSLDMVVVGGDLVLPQHGVPDFVNSTREALPPLRSGWEEVEVQEKGKEGNLGCYVE